MRSSSFWMPCVCNGFKALVLHVFATSSTLSLAVLTAALACFVANEYQLDTCRPLACSRPLSLPGLLSGLGSLSVLSVFLGLESDDLCELEERPRRRQVECKRRQEPKREKNHDRNQRAEYLALFWAFVALYYVGGSLCSSYSLFSC